jgi:hypothetical protein
MDEQRFNMSVRKIVVGVTSQHEIERLVQDENLGGKGELKVKNSEGTGLEHIVEGTINLG